MKNTNRRKPRRSNRYPRKWTWFTAALALVLFLAAELNANQDSGPAENRKPYPPKSGIQNEDDSRTQGEDASKPGGTLVVHFLDVGQGTATLFEQSGHFMLVDGGPSPASSYVVAYLQEQGVETLDYVVASHYDSDHLSGILGVMNVFEIETLIAPDYEHDSKLYESYVRMTEEQGIEPYYPVVGDEFSFGAASFTIVCPDGYSDRDSNDNSVGLRVVFGDTGFLVLGDAEADSEAQMLLNGIEVASDVYLVSHHGSSSSTTDVFLNTVNPRYCVISCGADNSYGHPHEETLEKIRERNIALFRTDLQGEIIATSDGTNITWNVEPLE